MVRTILAALILCAISTTPGKAQMQQTVDLMPVPAKAQLSDGRTSDRKILLRRDQRT